MNDLGITFKNIRKTKNLTLQDISNDEISVSMLSKFENGLSRITVDRFNTALDNMNVSIEEFYHINRNLNQSSFNKLFSKINKLKNNNDVNGLLKLYKQELNKYEENSKNKFNILNSIIIGSYIKSLDKKFKIKEDHLEILNDYLFGIEMWGEYEMILFNEIPEFISPKLYFIYAKEMVNNVEKLKDLPSILNSIQITLINGLSLSIEEKNYEEANFFLNKAKKYINNSRDAYMIIVLKFMEGYYNIFGNNINIGKQMIEESLDILDKLGFNTQYTYYKNAYDEIKIKYIN